MGKELLTGNTAFGTSALVCSESPKRGPEELLSGDGEGSDDLLFASTGHCPASRPDAVATELVVALREKKSIMPRSVVNPLLLRAIDREIDARRVFIKMHATPPAPLRY
jgi:hypothetical protein